MMNSQGTSQSVAADPNGAPAAGAVTLTAPAPPPLIRIPDLAKV
jgi:hypothetical protein